MEIPYIVEARKDTGLFNAKIAIWLFLASEVMLFGGLFSAYIFLRLGADFPWPERALPIMPGLINTAILIASSVTVVFAWAELKLRNWRKFQIYMSITLLCAVVFMAIKLPIEYKSKFEHQAIRLNDFSVLEGHVLKKKEYDGKVKHADSLGNYLRIGSTQVQTYRVHPTVEDVFHQVEGFQLSANVTRFYPKYYKHILTQAEEKQFETMLYLGDNPDSFIQIGDKVYNNETKLSIETLEEFKSHYVEARTNNNKLNRKFMRAAWSQFREERANGKYPELDGVRDGLCLDPVKKIQKALIAESAAKYMNLAANFDPETDKNRIELPETVNFIIKGSGYLKFVPAAGNFGGGTTIRYGSANRKVLKNTADQAKFEQLAKAETAEEAKSIAEGIEFVEFKQSTGNILHRDKTEVFGDYKRTSVVRNDRGVAQLDDEGKVQTEVTKDIKSGIEIAIDQINLEHYVMKWERDDKADKLPLSAYLGSLDENLQFVPGSHTHTIDIFNEPETTIDYYSDKSTEGRASILKAWGTHMQWVHWRSEQLKAKGLEITDVERYSVTWANLVGYKIVGYDLSSETQYKLYEKDSPKWHSSMKGADHYKPEWEAAFPYAFIKRENIRLESNLTPKWNNYYAIYFTITGLHGLHVIGGAIVLGYYLFFGRKMYNSNPEWLANRVEVGGLFWHFVDLVWIFAFPIFYLM